jgi:hypothetical protein
VPGRMVRVLAPDGRGAALYKMQAAALSSGPVKWLIALAALEGLLVGAAVITALVACAGNGC